MEGELHGKRIPNLRQKRARPSVRRKDFLLSGAGSLVPESSEVAEKVRAWAQGAAGEVPCDVVIAYREYETWFLSTVESLRGECGISDIAVAPAIPESKRDAKGALEEFMPDRRAYSETLDQPAMSAVFDLGPSASPQPFFSQAG